jgi:hypothetical protein
LVQHLLGSISSARLFDTVPVVPVGPVLEWVKAKHEVFLQNGLVPGYVFDGARHDMKKLTHSSREKERAKIPRGIKSFESHHLHSRQKSCRRAMKENHFSM